MYKNSPGRRDTIILRARVVANVERLKALDACERQQELVESRDRVGAN
jgi:hypothetical protein